MGHSGAAARRGGDGGARRLLLHTCRCCTALSSSRGATSAARRSRHQVLHDLQSVATRCAAACGAPPRMQHHSRCCAPLRLRRGAPSAAFRTRLRRPQQYPRTAPRCASRWAPRCGVCSWCWFTGELAAPSAASRRSRKTLAHVAARRHTARGGEVQASGERLACVHWLPRRARCCAGSLGACAG